MWKDAQGHGTGWSDLDEHKEEEVDLVCYTLGFLLEELADHYLIAGSRFRSETTVGDVNRIPKGMCVKLIHLEMPMTALRRLLGEDDLGY